MSTEDDRDIKPGIHIAVSPEVVDDVLDRNLPEQAWRDWCDELVVGVPPGTDDDEAARQAGYEECAAKVREALEPLLTDVPPGMFVDEHHGEAYPWQPYIRNLDGDKFETREEAVEAIRHWMKKALGSVLRVLGPDPTPKGPEPAPGFRKSSSGIPGGGAGYVRERVVSTTVEETWRTWRAEHAPRSATAAVAPKGETPEPEPVCAAGWPVDSRACTVCNPSKHGLVDAYDAAAHAAATPEPPAAPLEPEPATVPPWLVVEPCSDDPEGFHVESPALEKALVTPHDGRLASYLAWRDRLLAILAPAAAAPLGAGPAWDEPTLTMLAEGALCVLEGRGLLRQMGELGHQGAVEGLVDAFRLDLRTTAPPSAPQGGPGVCECCEGNPAVLTRYDATDGGGPLRLCDECCDERRAAYGLGPAASPPHGERPEPADPEKVDRLQQEWADGLAGREPAYVPKVGDRVVTWRRFDGEDWHPHMARCVGGRGTVDKVKAGYAFVETDNGAADWWRTDALRPTSDEPGEVE